MTAERVVMVCLEAMEPTLMERWAAEGELPNIRDFIPGTARSRFEFDGATENVVTWASMATGTALGEHGVWELFGWDGQNYAATRNNFDEVFPGDPFWVPLGRSGRRVTILDWPRTLLRGGVNVEQAADWMTHFRSEPFRATDEALFRDLQDRFSVIGSHRDFDGRLLRDDSLAGALDFLAARIDIKTRYVEERLRRRDRDFFMVDYTEAHDAGHRYWALHDRDHPQHDPRLADSVGDPLLVVYRKLDEAFGRLLEAADPDTVVMLYTSSGMEPNYSGNGLLDYFLGSLNGHRFQSFVERPCFELRHNPRAGAVRVNLQGRDSRGVIPASAYDDYCAELIGQLLELVDTETGRPVVDAVVKCRERFPGPRQDLLPDLMVLWSREGPIRGFESPLAGRMEFGDFRPTWTGDHSTNAVLYTRMPGGSERNKCPTISRFEQFPGYLGGVFGVDLPGSGAPLAPGLEVGRYRRDADRPVRCDEELPPPVAKPVSARTLLLPDSLFRHRHWARAAAMGVDDLREQLVTGYRDGKPFSPHRYDFVQPGARVDSLLDFGCGIGRNFPALRRIADRVVAFDIPEMVDACRRHADCEGVELVSGWQDLGSRHFDLAVATLVFQHLSRPVATLILRALAGCCDFLYLSTRSWSDDRDHPNVYEVVRASGAFEFQKGTCTEREALAIRYPAERHMDLLLRSTHAGARRARNGAIFGLESMVYEPVAERLPLVLTQLFTPNYDHWAYKVLDNKREYCERHGYRFHYRRGVYPHAEDRHPSWHRVPLLLELFDDPGTGWVFWSDIDSLILRRDVRLETLMAGHLERDLIVPCQGGGTHLGEAIDDCLCFGQFFIRNSEWSRRFLEAVWQFPERYGYPEFIDNESWEQEAVNFIYRNDLLDFSRHAAVVPNRLFNSFYHTQYREGDFLVHFAGEAARGEGRREALIDEYLGAVRDDGAGSEATEANG